MKFLPQVVIVCLLVMVADSADRVSRSLGKNCPRDIDFPKGANCKRCVKYRQKGAKATLRCPRGFSRYGNKRLLCGNDGLWKGDFPLCVKSGCSPIHTMNDLNLIMSEHPKFDDAVISFQCEADSIMFGPSEIHCDGVNWSSLPPRCAAITDLLSCDFEEDLCGWTQDSTVIGNQNWTRGIGPTMTGGTGPRRDHTHPNSDTGHYMYLETSAPTQEGDKAVLVSPMYTEDFSPMCFEFWYHMLGPDDYGHVGSLDVYIKAESDQFEFLQPAFHKEGNQGDSWHKGDIFIDDQIESYQLLIVATKMKSYISDISIDDVRLYNCTQTTSSTTTTTVQTPTTSITPSTTPAAISSELSTENISTQTQSIGVSTVFDNTSQTSGVIVTTEQLPNNTETINNITEVSTTVGIFESTVVGRNATSMKPSLPTLQPSTMLLMNSTPGTLPTVTSQGSSSKLIRQTTTTVPKRSTTTFGHLTSSTAKATTTSRNEISSTTVSTVITTNPVTTTKQSTELTTIPTKASTLRTTTITTTPKLITTRSTLPKRPSTAASTQTELTTSFKAPTSSAQTPRAKSSTDYISSTHPIRTTSSSAATSNTQSVSSTIQKSQQTSSTGATVLSTNAIQSSTPNTTVVVKTTSKLDKTNIDIDNNATAKAAISKHPEDDTLKPLMIGLGVGIIVGLIIIGIIVWACMRRRKFYKRGYEDELKPITNAASTQSLNNVEYYQDDFDIEHIQ